MNETICVIGATGFIGSHVAAELLRRGYSVRGTTRSPEENRWIGKAFENFEGEFSLVRANVRDRESLEKAMKGCSGVIMSAGVETQKPETVALMMDAAKNTSRLQKNSASSVSSSPRAPARRTHPRASPRSKEKKTAGRTPTNKSRSRSSLPPPKH